MRWPAVASCGVPAPTQSPSAEVAPEPTSTPGPDLPASVEGLADSVREALALALHERWHRPQHEGDRVACARLSGAFDDVAAIEPVILALLRGA